ncbi:MAG: hypothetical protein IKA31_05665 [Clostridia bacterium]|nr:hypothetical protein [Clostridia bacterium]
MKGLIAVDGGGTKTEFILTDTKGNVLTRSVYAGTNLNSVTYEQAFLTLATGLMDIYKVADKNEVEVAGAFFGLAGGVNGKNQQLIYNYFKPRYFENVPFSNHGDELNAINAGVKHAPNGIVVIAGTGSNVSIKKDGEILPNPQLSGWGYMFDNGGSGFDYGRDAVLAAKADINGTGEQTVITEMLEKKLECPVFDSLKLIYSGGPAVVASLAPIVFDACRKNDEVATRIVENQATNVANLINNAHVSIGKETDAIVGLVGGIFAHEKEILEPLITSQIDQNLTVVFPKESQIYGALMEAAKNAEVETDEAFLQNFNNTIANPILQNDMNAVLDEQAQ